MNGLARTWSRAVWGTALVVAPGAVLASTGTPADPTARSVARVLGVRHLLQATALAGSSSGTSLRLGAAADAVHATTALGLAAADRRRRRAGLADAGLALVWAWWGLHDATAG